MNKIVITKSKLEAIILKEQHEQENYMFFSNLEQIERQCKLLRNVGPDKINELLLGYICIMVRVWYKQLYGSIWNKCERQYK